MKQLARILIVVLAVLISTDALFAQRRGGGGRGGGGFRGGGGGRGGFSARSSARPSINARPSQRPSRDFNRPSSRPDRGQAARPDRGRQPDRGRERPSQLPSRGDRINTGDRVNNIGDRNNVNIDRDTNVDIDDGWGNGCCDWDDDYPWGAGLAIGAAAAVTAAAVGSVVYTLPPSCSDVYVNGVWYNECSGTYYQPQFEGTNTTYIVVDDPH